MNWRKHFESRAARYGLAVVAVAVATVVESALPAVFGGAAYLVFYPAVVAVAAFGGFGPGIVATVASTLIVDGMFLKPEGIALFHDPLQFGRSAVFLFGGLLIGAVAESLRRGRLRELEQSEKLIEESRLTDMATVFILDAAHRIVRWTRGCERLYGFTMAEALDRVSHDLLQTQFPEPLETIQARLRTAGRWEGELIHRRKDGQSVTVASVWLLQRDSQGKVAAILEVNSDISALKQAEQTLRESEQRFRTLANNISQLAWMADEKGSTFWYNERWYDYTDTTPEEMQGWGWQKVLHPDHVQRVVGKIRRCFETGEAWEDTFPLRGKDGEYRWYLSRAIPIHDEQGNVVRWFGTNTDVTERKAMEDELRVAQVSAERAKAAAEDASKAKDHFLAVLSHELRTPLTPVLASISMLQKNPVLDEHVGGQLEMARRNVELEARLIDDLLDLTRIARGKVELDKHPVELSTVIQRAVDVCRPDLEARGLHLGVDLGNARWVVEADIARLQQVFWNLLRNAIKFTPHDGCVGVKCHPQNGSVLVEVTDSGVGIEPQALPRIFDAFAQADRGITRQFGGLGLGLAICKSLIEMHGGNIEAHSEGKNKGATFVVRLPVVTDAMYEEAVVAPSGQAAETPSGKYHPLRVFVVEDHGDTAEMLRLMLESEGHEVCTAGDVASALETIDGDDYDLLLSDLGLPDGSGLDLIRELRARGNRVPAIALSGYGQEQDLQLSHQAGFSAHVIKPVDYDQLMAAVAKVSGKPEHTF